ncbi:substrate-binding periplasmic protein [Thalassospira mesophila]|uniref:Solute-binding protein family 3/N-terminal domain-containing protein n=1 Tax=Thalassospira mesophila TaxID=1293891 RepID=A0A1Y2L0C6_9PROT|nr:transporter substrate-binding domain-containing protein [Thalassospira mesophila]OSQ38274.1 hypothetical protein TMES_10300 [Thalassospira mesophila]
MKNKRSFPGFRLRIQAVIPTWFGPVFAKTLTVSLLCIAALTLPRLAAAQGACNKITVGYSNYPPFSYQTDDGGVTGASIEVAQRAFRKMHIEVSTVQMPWARLLSEAERGTVDMITAAYRTDARRSWAVYADIPIGYERVVVIHDRTVQADVASLRDLRYRKGLLRRGDSHGPTVDRAIANKSINIETVPEIEAGLRMVSAGRADYLLSSDAVARNVLRERQYPELSYDRLDVNGEGLYALFSRRSPCSRLVEEFNRTLRQLNSEHLLPTVLVQYLQSVGSPLVVNTASNGPRHNLAN